MAYLLVISGQSAGTSFDLTRSPLNIGGDATQDIQLLDRQISGNHLVIERNAHETYTVKTQPKAKNGMRVNDKSAAEAVLANGDRIRIGETEILFLATDQASQVEAVKRIRVLSTTPTVRPTKPTKRRLSKTK